MIAKLKCYAVFLAGLVAMVCPAILAIWHAWKSRRRNDLAKSAMDLAISENKRLKKQSIRDRLAKARESVKDNMSNVQKNLVREVESDNRTLANVVDGLRAEIGAANSDVEH